MNPWLPARKRQNWQIVINGRFIFHYIDEGGGPCSGLDGGSGGV